MASKDRGTSIRPGYSCNSGGYIYIYFFFQNKIVGHCVVCFLAKLAALYKLLPFENWHFF